MVTFYVEKMTTTRLEIIGHLFHTIFRKQRGSVVVYIIKELVLKNNETVLSHLNSTVRQYFNQRKYLEDSRFSNLTVLSTAFFFLLSSFETEIERFKLLRAYRVIRGHVSIMLSDGRMKLCLPYCQ